MPSEPPCREIMIPHRVTIRASMRAGIILADIPGLMTNALRPIPLHLRDRTLFPERSSIRLASTHCASGRVYDEQVTLRAH